MISFERAEFSAGLTLVLRLPSFLVFEIWFRFVPKDSSWSQQGMNILVVTAVILLMVVPPPSINQLYWFFLRACPVIFAYFYTADFMESKNEDKDLISMGVFRDIVVLYLSGLFSDYLFHEKSWTKVFLVAYALPLLTRKLCLSIAVINFSHYLANEAIFYYLLIKLFHILLVTTNLLHMWVAILENCGLQAFSKFIACDVRLSKQFLVYWSLSFLYHVFCYLIPATDSNSSPVNEMDWSTLFFVSAGECCISPLGLVAMCNTVLYAYKYFNAVLNILLHGWDNYPKFNQNLTWTHGFTILLMYVRSGLLPSAKNLESPFLGAFKIKTVLLSACIWFLNMTYCNTHAVIMSFSTTPTTKPFKHIRGLLIYIFIILFSVITVTMVYQFTHISENINVLSVCLTTCVQALASIIIYIIFVYDGIYSRPWESMDDIVYNIWSTIQLINVVMSSILAFADVYFIHREDISWLRLVFIAGLCNLQALDRLKKQWENLQERRKIMNMIDLLPTVTEEQMLDSEEVCSICQYSIMTAKVTPCGHFFHQMCLKKWMYVNDICPVCRKSVSSNSLSKNESDVLFDSGSHIESGACNESDISSESDSHSEYETLDEYDNKAEPDSLDKSYIIPEPD